MKTFIEIVIFIAVCVLLIKSKEARDLLVGLLAMAVTGLAKVISSLFHLLTDYKAARIAAAALAVVAVAAFVIESKADKGSDISGSGESVSSVCSVCDGTGLCSRCEGVGDNLVGDDIITCRRCSGTGHCSTCGGDGIVDLGDIVILPDTDPAPVSTSNGNMNTTVPCSACGGTGKIERTGYAINFGSSGDTSYTYYETCTVCGGKGYWD